jgi:hypothetical protein
MVDVIIQRTGDEQKIVEIDAEITDIESRYAAPDEVIAQSLKPEMALMREKFGIIVKSSARCEPAKFKLFDAYFGLSIDLRLDFITMLQVAALDAAGEQKFFEAFRAVYPTPWIIEQDRAEQLVKLRANRSKIEKKIFEGYVAQENGGAMPDWSPLLPPESILEFKSSANFNRKRMQRVKDARDSARLLDSSIADRIRTLNEKIRATQLLHDDTARLKVDRDVFAANIISWRTQVAELIAEQVKVDPFRQRRADVFSACERFLREKGVDVSFLF